MSEQIITDSPNRSYPKHVFQASMSWDDMCKLVETGKEKIAERLNVPVSAVKAEVAWDVAPSRVLSRWFVSWQGVMVTLNGFGEVLSLRDSWMEVAG